MRFYVSVAIGLVINICYGSSSTVPADLDALSTVKTTYIPLIPEMTYRKAMEKLKEFWVVQYDYLKKMRQGADDIKNVTGYPIQQIYWIFNDTEERLEEHIDALSKSPWEYTAKMKQALDSDSIFQHRKSLEGLETCINDHYLHREEDEHELLFRKTLKEARENLLQSEQEIRSLVSEEQKTTTPKT